MSALTEQIEGSHYKNKPFQPVELAHLRGYDECSFSVLKYVTRHAEKNGLSDLRKAAHFVRLRQELLEKYGPVARLGAEGPNAGGVGEYIDENKIGPGETACLLINDLWHLDPYSAKLPGLLIEALENLSLDYGEPLCLN